MADGNLYVGLGGSAKVKHATAASGSTVTFTDSVTLAGSAPVWVFASPVAGDNNIFTLTNSAGSAFQVSTDGAINFSQISIITYTLTAAVAPSAAATAGCNITGNSTLYHAGDPVSLTAHAVAGWTLSGWTGAYTSSNATLSFNMPAANVSVTANFIQAPTYTLTAAVAPSAAATAGCNITGNSTLYHAGDPVSLTAHAVAGWASYGWTGAYTSSNATLSFNMPAANVSVTANFTQTTGVIMSPGGGVPPVVKAMWAHDAGDSSAVASESGDPSHLTLGVQIAPNIGFQATKQITFAAIVTDENGVDNITHVYADVYELDNTTLKFEVELTRHGTDDFMKSLFDQAAAAGPTGANTPNGTIVGMTSINTNAVDPSYNVPITKADIDTELDQQLAAKYWGTWQFDNCQLAGRYRVVINAFNVQAKVGSFEGWMDWCALTAADFDFSSVDYGNVTLGVHKQIGGDRVFGGALRTIENVGNTYLKMTVKQDDMGLGSTMINGVSTWNVHYDFRLGDGDIPAAANPAFVNYDPAVAKGGNLSRSILSFVITDIEALRCRESGFLYPGRQRSDCRYAQDWSHDCWCYQGKLRC